MDERGYWFDTQDGCLIDDETAAVRITEGEAAVVGLGELLLAPKFPFKSGDFTPANVDDWERQHYIEYGKWVLKLVEQEDNNAAAITQKQLNRLHILGVGPETRRIKIHTDAATLADFRKQIGAPAGRARGRYAQWGLEQFLTYARRLAADLQKKPTIYDYDAASARGEGPNTQTIEDSLVKGVRNLNDLIGYPNVGAWEKDDFIAWGAKVMRSNNGRPLTATVLNILSKRRRGPEHGRIYSHFESLPAFAQKVSELYEFEQQVRDDSRKAKNELYTGMIRKGIFPAAWGDLPEPDLFSIGGKYLVVHDRLPWLENDRKQRLALKPPATFIKSLQKLEPGLTAGKVEVSAVMLDVFDDIWPMADEEEYLQISDEELTQVRKEIGEKKRQRLAKKVANTVPQAAPAA